MWAATDWKKSLHTQWRGSSETSCLDIFFALLETLELQRLEFKSPPSLAHLLTSLFSFSTMQQKQQNHSMPNGTYFSIEIETCHRASWFRSERILEDGFQHRTYKARECRRTHRAFAAAQPQARQEQRNMWMRTCSLSNLEANLCRLLSHSFIQFWRIH